MAKITFEDKIALDEQAAIADVNKISASDINQIKTVVNGLDDTVSNLGTTLSSSYLPLNGGVLKGDLSFNHTNSTTDGHISWIQGTYQQRLKIIDNSASGSKTFTFQSSSDSGTNWTTLATIANNGTVTATTFVGALSGNATTATTASKADRLTTGRTLTIGNTGKEFAGNANVSWSLSEIGAAAASHTHSYLPLSGGSLTGSPYIYFPASAGSTTTDMPMALTYGRLQAYGTLCINADTDGSTTEYLILTSGRGKSSSVADGLAIGYVSLTWRGANVPTVYVQSGTPSAKQTGDIWFSQEVNYGTYNF